MIINKINFPIYNIIIIISVLSGLLYILLSLYNDKLLNKKIIIFVIMFFIFSFFGGKLYTYLLFDYDASLLKSSLSSYGGLVFAILSAIIYEKIFKGEKNVIKYTILSLPLIYSFTKIACAINGCCYGIEYDGVFSVIYPHVMNKPLFPVQALEVIVFFITFIICNKNKNRKDITYITLLLISVFKYLIEFLRYGNTSLINQNQIFSIILFVITIIVYCINHFNCFRKY